jgi:hypothetical protein
MSRAATPVFGDVGYLLAEALISADERARLLREARTERPFAQRLVTETFCRSADGRALAPGRQWVANPGETLTRLHHSGELAAGLRRLARRAVRPTFCSYVYYGQGDFVGLHSDDADCAIVMLVWLGGPAGPLHVNPELQGLTPARMLREARQSNGHPAGGVALQLKEATAVLAGDRVPHHRPPHAHKRELTLATLCFRPAKTRSAPPYERAGTG